MLGRMKKRSSEPASKLKVLVSDLEDTEMGHLNEVSDLEDPEMGHLNDTPVLHLSKFASQLPRLSSTSASSVITHSQTVVSSRSSNASILRSFSSVTSHDSHEHIGRSVSTNGAVETADTQRFTYLMRNAGSFTEFGSSFNLGVSASRREGPQSVPQQLALLPPTAQLSSHGPPLPSMATERHRWHSQLLQLQNEALSREIAKSEAVFLAAQDGYVSEVTVRMQVDLLSRVGAITARLNNELRGHCE
jgi:hypothetical protein